MLDKSLYTTVLSQTFSNCGNYLLAGNSYGEIAIYNLSKLFNPKLDNFTYSNKATNIFTYGENSQICSMVTTSKFLIIGTQNHICGWDWDDVTNLKWKNFWTIELPKDGSTFDSTDVNSLWWNEELETLYAGCGNNEIYSFDIDNGRLVQTFSSHSDYIHSLHGQNSRLISSGEDGQVILWDARSNKPANKLTPHKDAKLSRPDLGKWIGAASLGDDWIVCGGGPRLSLWQTRNLQVSTIFDLPDHGIHVSHFNEDRIIAGGVAKHLYQLNYSGEVVVQIPISATTVYSAVHQTKPFQVFSIAGSSNCIDLCNNMNYKDQTLLFK